MRKTGCKPGLAQKRETTSEGVLVLVALFLFSGCDVYHGRVFAQETCTLVANCLAGGASFAMVHPERA